jgi:outer membrane lipoprotein-sorting protein
MNFKIKSLIATLCVLLLFTAACNRDGKTGSSGAGVSPSGSGGGNNAATTAAAISADDKPLDVMTKAMRAQLDAKSYRANVTSSMSDGTTSSMLIEYAAPDRYRMTTEAKPGGGKSYQMEYVIVGGATYLKAPNGGWVRSPIDAGGMIKAFRDPKMLDELTKTADVKYVGAETLDGEPVLVYQYTQNNPMGMNLKSTSKTWLSVADGLPRKTESEGEFNGQKTKTLVKMSDYNSDIKIEAPSK